MNLHMSAPPDPRTKDFFASPALSLSLAGVFRGAPGAAAADVEEGDEESGGGGGREEAVDISSENTGPGRSEDDAEGEELQEEEGDERGKKKRKKYHRHTAEQIREMEALFKESPHPDEKQRQQLSKKLGLNARQVKFWFQNRRTQIKAIQERHENSLLKTEMDKLRDENQSLRETIKKASCPNCGFASLNQEHSSAMINTEEQQLRIENAKLKAEVEKLRSVIGKFPGGTVSPSSSCSGGNDQENRSSLDFYTGFFGLERSRVTEIANRAMNELAKMASAGEPLWVRSLETGREILNYDEYAREFLPDGGAAAGEGPAKRSIEVSRETGVVFLDMPRLVQVFMDAKQWMEMFPCLIAKAATVSFISNGDGENRNGVIQLMFAELQILTPMVPTREVYFIRHCKQLSPESWAIVDVSIDKVEDSIDASIGKCRKRPSGCIIQDKCNGHCKVTWVEHLECQKTTLHTLYRSIVSSGLAFGAKHWMATLQLQCERLVFSMATNVPTKDSSGIATLAGRKSVLKLAQRMTGGFCRAIGASTHHAWSRVPGKGGEGMRVACRRNIGDPGEPQGLILCAVSSVWLPVSPHALFDFLRDDARWNEWDIMSAGGQVQTIANLSKGQDRGNSVTVHADTKSEEATMWILQDSCKNAFESMIVHAPVEISRMQSVMTGVDSSSIPLLPSGFSILPHGLDSRPLVISSRPEERNMEGGSILTVAFQILADPSPTEKLTTKSMEIADNLISCTLQNIKTSLQCEDS